MNDTNESPLPAIDTDAVKEGAGSWLAPALVFGGAAVLAAGMFQAKRSASAEKAHPPIGRFMKVGDTTFHYADIGEGPPIVLLHGLGMTMEDWFISGVLDELLPLHRLIIVDRPGYGYTRRPSGQYGPEREARRLADMLHRLGAHDAVIVGHSAGVLPALSLALSQSQMVRSLVLISGAYFPGATLAQLGDTLPDVPAVGGLLRTTVTPSLARAALPALLDRLFEPQPVPRRFDARFPVGLVTRPQQLKCAADDAAELQAVLARLSPHYERIDRPVTVIAGSGDALVDPDSQSRAFADQLGHARLIVVPAMGHMVHHSAAARVAAAIVDTFTGEVVKDDPGPPPQFDVAADDEGIADEDDDAAAGDADDRDGDTPKANRTSAEAGGTKGGQTKRSSGRRRTSGGQKRGGGQKSTQSAS